jgi:hypothetical protein
VRSCYLVGEKLPEEKVRLPFARLCGDCLFERAHCCVEQTAVRGLRELVLEQLAAVHEVVGTR